MIKSVLDANPTAHAFALGDTTERGTAEEFESYHSAWGSFKDRTFFQIGNHECKVDRTGSAYYDYVGELVGERGKGYYAKTLGSWRCYFLNSQIQINDKSSREEQTTWLANDLSDWSGSHQIMAMWHQPMFASVCQHHGRAMAFPNQLGPWWKLLQDHGAEIAISGHVHRYERFRRMLRNGSVSNRGIRQFTVGTGGVKPMPILSVHPNSEFQMVTRGVFRLDLHADRYEWKFTDITGVERDSGVQMCRRSVTV